MSMSFEGKSAHSCTMLPMFSGGLPSDSAASPQMRMAAVAMAPSRKAPRAREFLVMVIVLRRERAMEIERCVLQGYMSIGKPVARIKLRAARA